MENRSAMRVKIRCGIGAFVRPSSRVTSHLGLGCPLSTRDVTLHEACRVAYEGPQGCGFIDGLPSSSVFAYSVCHQGPSRYM
jgi:hypothetical protein